MTTPLRLAVVIVNYRTADLVIDCLVSLLDEPDGLPSQSHIIVVDGGSADGSAERLDAALTRNTWLDRAELVALPDNGGFAYGNNRGLERIRRRFGEPEHVLFLNPDTVVRPGALRELLTFLDENPDVGIVGSLLEDPDTTPQTCAFRFPTIASELEGEARTGLVSRLLARWRVVQPTGGKPCRVAWVSGASMMVRREVIRDVGSFDESYFLYYEELDLCLRAAKAGWACFHVPQSRVVHLVGASTGVTKRRGALKRRPDYWYESRQRYYLKHHGRLYLACADLAWVAGHMVFRAKQFLRRDNDGVPPHLLGDFVRHSFSGQTRANSQA